MNQNILLLTGLGIGILIKLVNLRNVAKLISSKDAKAMINENKIDTILDVRSNEEYSNGHYPNSINLSYDSINKKSVSNFPKNKNILVYCRSGRRAKIASDKLNKLGFESIYYIKDTYESII